MAEYKEEISQLRKDEQHHKLLYAVFNPTVQLHRTDVQHLLVLKEDLNQGLDQKDPACPHIKEEQEAIWTSQEAEQFQRLDEDENAHLQSTSAPLKSEAENEKPHDYGQSQLARNLEPHCHLQTNTDPLKTKDSDDDRQETSSASATVPKDSENWESITTESGLNIQISEICGSDTRCTSDNKSFGHNLKVQMEKEFGCDVCGKIFMKQRNLKNHMSVHTGKRSFGCDICGKRFAQQEHLKIHMRVHTGEKPFDCEVCGKRFSVRYNMETHKRGHTEEKPFVCDVCGKRITQQRQLKLHMRIHTGEKPFACGICGKRFPQRRGMKHHMRLHTGEKPIGCDVCEKRFALREYLRKHMKIHRLVEKIICDICGKRKGKKNVRFYTQDQRHDEKQLNPLAEGYVVHQVSTTEQSVAQFLNAFDARLSLYSVIPVLNNEYGQTSSKSPLLFLM